MNDDLAWARTRVITDMDLNRIWSVRVSHSVLCSILSNLFASRTALKLKTETTASNLTKPHATVRQGIVLMKTKELSS